MGQVFFCPDNTDPTKEDNTMKKIIAALLVAVMTLCACAMAEGSYKVGICNYVDDASLNQIVENIQNQRGTLAAEGNVTIDIDYQNCNADASVMQQIISNFIANGVDVMVGVATPVAMTMQSMTEDNKIPVVFAAVSDPLATQLVETLEQIGIVPIEAVGKPFNPDLHNAVMHVEDETVDENTVVEEFQKGYTYNGSVVRYSMVKVAN